MDLVRPNRRLFGFVAIAAAFVTLLSGCGFASHTTSRTSVVASGCGTVKSGVHLKLVLADTGPRPEVLGSKGAIVEVVSNWGDSKMSFPRAAPFDAVCEITRHRSRGGAATVVYKVVHARTIEFTSTYTHWTRRKMPFMAGVFSVAPPRKERLSGCSASQLIAGKATHEWGLGTINTASVYVQQPILNSGASCTVYLPKTIEAMNAKGIHRRIKVVIVLPTSFRIPSRGRSTITIGAWWPMVNLPRWKCAHPIANVTKVAIPLSAGDLQINLGVVWHRACKSPANTSLMQEN